jgi:hypothetical protein
LPYPSQTVSAATNYAPDAGDADDVKKEFNEYMLAN